MGWIILIVMVIAAFVLVWRYGRMPRHILELSGALLAIGIIGYAWQGVPDQPGSPIAGVERKGVLDPEAVAMRHLMAGRFGGDAQWLDLTDRLIEMGQTQTAIVAARSGLRDNRNSPALWVGLGNALVAHGEGLVSPAATFAYRRAAQIAPEDPQAPYFYGLALAKSGQIARAQAVWTRLLQRTPANAPWRPEIAARLATIAAIAPE